jgi:hypothetical protein
MPFVYVGAACAASAHADGHVRPLSLRSSDAR